MKKGQGMQFNWIFVVVAGGVILAVLAAFTFRYIGLQNQRANVEIAKTLEINFKLLETTEFSLPIDLGTVNKIEFNCLGNDEYLLINDNYKQDIKNVVMFAPKTTRTKQLAGWITSWEYPFLVGKFLYVSGFDNKYFFVGNSELLNDVPSLFNTEIISSYSDADVKEESKTKFIYFTKPYADLKKIQEKYPKARVIYINEEDKKVTFYEDSEEKTEDYYGDAFFYGAIFADNHESYKCGLERAVEKLKTASKVYISKTNYVSNLDRRVECQYPSLKSSLDSFAKGNLNDETAENLDNQNKRLYGEGCPAVF